MEIISFHAGAAGRIEVKDAGSFRIHTLGATTGTYAGPEAVCLVVLILIFGSIAALIV